MVGVNAAVFAPVLHDDLEKTMERILASGCDAVVGGYSACILAEHRGIPSVVIKTGQDTVARAVDEAVRTVDRIRGERVISQMYKTIIYSSEDGLLYVDRNGVIPGQKPGGAADEWRCEPHGPEAEDRSSLSL